MYLRDSLFFHLFISTKRYPAGIGSIGAIFDEIHRCENPCAVRHSTITRKATPEESLQLAYGREVEDVREAGHTPDAMTEFIRDMIANLDDIYHVVSYGDI